MKDNINMEYIDNEAKEALLRIATMLNDERSSIRNSSPSLVVEANSGAGVSTYAKQFSYMVDSSIFLETRGEKTFLELVFPKDNEHEEQLFYQSPKIAASYKNKFYGTMLISLAEFKGDDLLNSQSFERLTSFVENHKENIKFIFHILPTFEKKDYLIARLLTITNVIKVSIDYLDVDRSLEYVINGIVKENYEVNEHSRETLREVIDVMYHSKNYKGFKSLNQLIERLYFELTNKEQVLEQDVFEVIKEKIRKESELFIDNTNKIGFK